MMTHLTSHHKTCRPGFTLVELLVGMTIIAILAGMLTVAVSRGLISAQEFAVTNEMTQIESALEEFRNDYGFYPPSFKEIENVSRRPVNQGGGGIAAANLVLSYLNRISPNNAESQLIAGTGRRRIDLWWQTVGQHIGDNPGSELVFWLSSLSKNRQFPLTVTIIQTDGSPQVFALTAHSQSTLAGDPERQIYFEFDETRLTFAANDAIATPLQASGKGVPYLYRDAGINYFPNDPTDATDNTGAYTNAIFQDLDGVTRRPIRDDIVDAFFHLDTSNEPNNPRNRTLAESQTIFNRIFPNADSYQLISFGLDGEPGGPSTCDIPMDANPNIFSATCAQGADNFVNFGSGGVTKLQVAIEELN